MSPIVPPERVEEILEPFGGVEAVVEGLRLAEANQKYLEAHREALTDRYPDQWVAIVGERVVAHGDSAQGVGDAVRETYGTLRGMHREYLSTQKRTWLL